MGQSMSSAVSSVVEKKLSAYLPVVGATQKEKENDSMETKSDQRSVPSSILQRARSFTLNF